jgi:glycosyltransferase involved in cell wall biosynthesis
MRILQVESSPNFGGQEYGWLLESKELVKRGHFVFLAISVLNEKLIKKAHGFGLPFPLLPFKSSFDPISIAKIVKICKTFNIDVIHCHSSKDHWSSYFATKIYNAPILRWRHIINPIASTWHRSFIYRHGCKFLVVRCDAIKEDMIKNNKITQEKIFVIPAGVDLCLFDPLKKSNNVRKQFGIAPSATLIGIIALLRPEKGHKYFLKAAYLLSKKYPNIYFLIVGEEVIKGISLEELKKEVIKLGLKDRVFFSGYREDIAQILSTLDLLVVSSYAVETTSQVILQALAMKKPVVATNIGGIPQSLCYGKAGMLVPPKNSQAIAKAIEYLIQNPKYTKDIIAFGYEHVRKNFSLKGVVDKIEELQERIVK